MKVEDISFPSAQENVIYDQTLLESAEATSSGEVLRFWEARNFFIVLGRTSKIEDDVKIENTEKDGVEIVRRTSGGGTVLEGPGCLNYSFVLSYENSPRLREIRKAYEIVLNGICNSLRKMHVDADFQPISDMAVRGKKFSGNAQARKRRFMLHHGTLLYDFPVEMVERYLKMPKEEPPYRRGRDHRDFLTNIDIRPCDIKEAIESAAAKFRIE